MNGTRSKYTVWHYVGCGCVVLFVLAVLGIGGCFFAVTQWGRQVAEEIKDPEARAAKARSLLGYDELPAGYYPGVSFSVPFAMDLVILGDHELPAGEAMKHMDEDDVIRERGFIYFRIRDFGAARESFRQNTDFDFEAERTVAEGEVEAGGATVRYVAEIGTAHVSGHSMRSVSAELDVDCDDGYRRHAVWFTPAPGGETAEEPAAMDLAGTPADEAALVEFLDHFRFCG